MTPKISIVVPCYNEEKIIFKSYKEIKQELEKLNLTYEIVFCNDGSTDRSLEIFNRIKNEDLNVKLINYSHNRGLAYAYKQLFNQALGEIIITMDADLSMQPKNTLPLFLKEIENADVIVGSRYAGVKPEYPLYRRIPSKINLFLARIFLNCQFSDTNSGFLVIRKKVLQEIELISIDLEIHIELLLKAMRKGFVVREVPIMYIHKTESGEMSILRHGPKTFVGILKLWLEMKRR